MNVNGGYGTNKQTNNNELRISLLIAELESKWRSQTVILNSALFMYFVSKFVFVCIYVYIFALLFSEYCDDDINANFKQITGINKQSSTTTTTTTLCYLL